VRNLKELAEHCGIDLAYYDIWGELHVAPEATLRERFA
jgi:hypothetical protein